jgi:hypothetical protein
MRAGYFQRGATRGSRFSRHNWNARHQTFLPQTPGNPLAEIDRSVRTDREICDNRATPLRIRPKHTARNIKKPSRTDYSQQPPRRAGRIVQVAASVRFRMTRSCRASGTNDPIRLFRKSATASPSCRSGSSNCLRSLRQATADPRAGLRRKTDGDRHARPSSILISH